MRIKEVIGDGANTMAHPVEQAVIFVYKACEDGQRHKGKLSLSQCKEFITARDEIIGNIRNDPKFAEKDVMLAYLVIKQVAEAMQSTGVFTIDGADKILNNLIEIEKWAKTKTTPVEILEKKLSAFELKSKHVDANQVKQ